MSTQVKQTHQRGDNAPSSVKILHQSNEERQTLPTNPMIRRPGRYFKEKEKKKLARRDLERSSDKQGSGEDLKQFNSREEFQEMVSSLKEKIKKLESIISQQKDKIALLEKPTQTYAELNAKLSEIQAKLCKSDTDSDTDPEHRREREQLNIEYEKLITELEQTVEYQKELEEQQNKWKIENEVPNSEAFEKVHSYLKNIPVSKLNAVFKRKPELKFILRTPQLILKLHVNDFKQVSTQNLKLIEARALYYNMPSFRKDQEQYRFVEQLREKIQIEAGTPVKSPPPTMEAKKKVVIKTKKSGSGSGGDFLQELLQKRKKE